MGHRAVVPAADPRRRGVTQPSLRAQAKQSIATKEVWIASSRSLSSGRPKGRTRWLLAMTVTVFTIGLRIPCRCKTALRRQGDIIATPHRGLFTGNRGIIHDPETKTLTRRWAGKAWLVCVCEFRGRRREVMGGRSWTELFFLDEATALAAGHRPCFYCRRDDANRFRAAWEQGNRVAKVRARDIDRELHRERLSGGKKRLHPLPMPLKRAARWRDGAREKRELSDRAGPGAGVVAGRLSPGAECASRRDAAHATLDAARVVRGIPARAASKRTLVHARGVEFGIELQRSAVGSLPRLQGRGGEGASQIAVLVALPHPNPPPQAGEGICCRRRAGFSAAAGPARRRSSGNRAASSHERFAGNAEVPHRPAGCLLQPAPLVPRDRSWPDRY